MSGICDEEVVGTPEGKLECREDVAHLQGLDQTFARTANLVLSAQDKNYTVEFRVHKDVISGHSPILCQFIGDLPTAVDKLPHLPLVGDNCLAVRGVLADMYQAFATTRQSEGSVGALNSLTEWSVHFDRLCLADKYDMLNIRLSHGKALMVPLTKLVSQDYTKDCACLVLQILTIAEQCGCKAMLVSCEAYVVKHFQFYTSAHHKEMSKLSQASLLRISQGLVHCHEASMQVANDANTAAAKEVEASSVLYKAGDSCPRCNKALDHVYGRSTIMHKKQTFCTWPAKRVLKQSSAQVSIISSYLAHLAERQD